MTAVEYQQSFFKQQAILTYIILIILLFTDVLNTNFLKQQKRNLVYKLWKIFNYYFKTN